MVQFRWKRILNLIQIFFCGLENIFVTRVSPANQPRTQAFISAIRHDPLAYKRPWYRLVTCFHKLFDPVGGVVEITKLRRDVIPIFSTPYWRNPSISLFFSLHFALVNSVHWNVILRRKQVVCLEKLFLGMDVLGVLPTGYEKSLIFHVLPLIFFAKERLEKGIEFETLTCLHSTIHLLLLLLWCRH